MRIDCINIDRIVQISGSNSQPNGGSLAVLIEEPTHIGQPSIVEPEKCIYLHGLRGGLKSIRSP